MTTKRKKLELKDVQPFLSQQKREVLVGLLLGDGHLGTQSNGKTARLMYSQGGNGIIGDAHKRYLFYVFKQFKDWCNTSPREIARVGCFEKEDGKIYKAYTFQTKSHVAFVEHWRLFYTLSPIALKDSSLSVNEAKRLLSFKDATLPGDVLSSPCDRAKQFYYRKVVPLEIEKLLTPRSLTYWYMDDGSIKDKKAGSCLLNTQSFTYDECILLCKALSKNFGLDAQIRDKRRKDRLFGHQIYVSTRLNKIIDCFTSDYCTEMDYKLPRRTRSYTRNL